MRNWKTRSPASITDLDVVVVVGVADLRVGGLQGQSGISGNLRQEVSAPDRSRGEGHAVSRIRRPLVSRVRDDDDVGRCAAAAAASEVATSVLSGLVDVGVVVWNQSGIL